MEHALQRRRSGTTGARSQLSMPPVVDQGFLPPPHRRWVNHVQEFFVPVDRLTAFLRDLSELQRVSGVPVLTATVRLVRRSSAGPLPQAPEWDCFAVMCFLHTDRNAEALQRCKHLLRELTDAAQRFGGRPYLTYAWAQTTEQLQRAYPGLADHVRAGRRSGPTTSDFAERVDDEAV